jgi:nitrogen regulatory protein PII
MTPYGNTGMVLIEAYIKPFKLDDVKEALEEIGVGGITMSEVVQTAAIRGRGRSFGAPGTTSDVVPKIKIEIAAPAKLTEVIIEALRLHGSAGKHEDGRIIVVRIQGAVRIRTGESDDEAITT